jgi:hypothetical protein
MKSTCDKTSNNKYFDCPARMDDGRAFTDYRPSSTVNDMIRYSNNVMSSFEFRQFLTNNATKIMDVNNIYTKEKVGCGSCDYVEVPFQSQCTWNSTYGKCSMTNPNGIGLTNVVKPSDMKENFVPNGMNLQGAPIEYYQNSMGSQLNGQGAYDLTRQNVFVPEAYTNRPMSEEMGQQRSIQMGQQRSVPLNGQGAYDLTRQNVFVPEAYTNRPMSEEMGQKSELVNGQGAYDLTRQNVFVPENFSHNPAHHNGHHTSHHKNTRHGQPHTSSHVLSHPKGQQHHKAHQMHQMHH